MISLVYGPHCIFLYLPFTSKCIPCFNVEGILKSRYHKLILCRLIDLCDTLGIHAIQNC